MLKDRVEKKRSRTPAGKYAAMVLMSRLELIEEVMVRDEARYRQVVGLTALNTEYVGFCRARRKMFEASLESSTFGAPTVSLQVLTAEGVKLPSNVWQGWYRQPGERALREQTPFLIKIYPSRHSLTGVTLTEGPEGKLIPEHIPPTPHAEFQAAFEKAWGYDENLASYKRQILAKFRREDKEPLYEHMRNHPEIFEPYWKDLAAQGLDYKETLDEYYAKRRAESARFAAEKEVTILPAATADAPERVRGVMTLQELRRILDGFGELPPEGAEDSDEGWQAFESRFLAANGPEAKGPLRAALSIVRRELGATVASDAA